MNLGGLGVYSKLRNSIKPTYEPVSYWNKRGRCYINEVVPNNNKQIQKIITYLKTITFDSVLEIGCGYGRLTKEIINTFKTPDYTAIDLSMVQILNAKKYVNNYKINFINSSLGDYDSDKKYDLVFACEVFLHIPPKELRNFIVKAINYSKKHLIHIDPLFVNPINFSNKTHDFRHDYDKIYANFIAYKLNITPILHQGIFHLT